MTWHSETVTPDQLPQLIARIRHLGGVVTSCRRCTEGTCVTWTTA
jgi:hypothetical protein